MAFAATMGSRLSGAGSTCKRQCLVPERARRPSDTKSYSPPPPDRLEGRAEQFFDFAVDNSTLEGEGEPEARVKLPAFVGSGYVSQQTGKPSVTQQDGPDHCGGQHCGRVAGSVSGEDPVCLRQVRLGLSGIRDEQARLKPSVYRRDMALQPSLGVGCEPPRFYDGRRVRIDALVQA